MGDQPKPVTIAGTTQTFSRRKRSRDQGETSTSCRLGGPPSSTWNGAEGRHTHTGTREMPGLVLGSNSKESLVPNKNEMLRQSSKEGNVSKKREKKNRKMTQLHLDIGQRSFVSTKCNLCGFLYTPGDPAEDRLHHMHHQEMLSLNVLRVRTIPAGAKFVVSHDDDKIYKVEYVPKNVASQQTLILDLAHHVEREMGTVEGWIESRPCTVLIYINKSKEVMGCLFLEPHGVKAMQASETVSASKFFSGIVVAQDVHALRRSRCAVKLIWTSKYHRRKGVASKLLDCARSQVTPGQIIPREGIAFSQPTQEGCTLIRKYTGSHDFLVYEAIQNENK